MWSLGSARSVPIETVPESGAAQDVRRAASKRALAVSAPATARTVPDALKAEFDPHFQAISILSAAWNDLAPAAVRAQGTYALNGLNQLVSPVSVGEVVLKTVRGAEITTLVASSGGRESRGARRQKDLPPSRSR